MGLTDCYPQGDPEGYTCEQFLKQLARKGVDFHFAKITDYTDLMISVWKRDVYAGNDAAFFEEHNVRFLELLLAASASWPCSKGLAHAQYQSWLHLDQVHGICCSACPRLLRMYKSPYPCLTATRRLHEVHLFFHVRTLLLV